MPLAKLLLAEPFKATRHIFIHKNPFVIGRNSDCELVIDRTSISKRHAQIIYDGHQYLLQDLQSKNGTLLNGHVVQQEALSDRDLISVGGVDLFFHSVEETQFNADLEKSLTKIKSAVEKTKSINTKLILDPMLDEIMTALMELSQAERGFLLLESDDDQLQMVRSVNITAEELKMEKFRLSKTATDKAIQSKQAVVVSNALNDTYFGDQTSVQEMELKTLVCVPILGEEQHVIGILYADSDRREHEFAELDVELLESLAANAAMAIENARLNGEIWKLIGEVSDVLKAVEEKSPNDEPLQSSIRKSLDSLSSLKRKRFPKKGTVVIEDSL